MTLHPRSYRGPFAPCALAAAILVCSFASTAGATPRVVLTSPVAGARWVRPETGVLIRFDAATSSAPALRVVGSQSGAHAGATLLVDAGRALVFRPRAPFVAGEIVTVTVGGGTTFAFTTARLRAATPTPDALVAAALGDPAARGALARIAAPAAAPPVSAWPALDAAPRRVTGSDPPLGGKLFIAGIGQNPSYLEVSDDSGYAAFFRQMPAACFDFKLQPDGHLSYFDSARGMFMLMNQSYDVVDSIVCGNGYGTDVHELLMEPDGRALLLGVEDEIVDMRQYVAGGNAAATVRGNVVQELDPARNVIFEWRSFDHFAITDATHEDLTAAFIDDVHANALWRDTDGNILLSSRHLDEITKIDHTTGAIVWRLGGKNNQFTLAGDTQWFSHQHAIRRIANGDVTLFDNGNFNVPQVSRALEYSLDETNKVATLVWQYRNTPDVYGSAMGYVERLDDGSTLVSYGTGTPDMVQVRPNGTLAMTLNLLPGYICYRVQRDPLDAEVGVDPAPARPTRLALSAAVPNPCRTNAAVFLTLGAASPVTFQVFDVAGRKVAEVFDRVPFGPGTYRVPVDLAGRAPGVYFARVTTDAGTVSRRLMKLD